MKKQSKKLWLSRETVVQLTEKEILRAVAGSGWSDQSVCPSAILSECRSCG
jgi:hypothetical protein